MSFEQKKNLLFSSLESAEQQNIGTDSILNQHGKTTDYTLDRSGRRRPTKLISVDRYRGRESIFKRPAAPIGQCLKRAQLPDYQRNPHKWTKYTLEDVDTSERTNTAAAFSFLMQIEEQRDAATQIAERAEDDSGPRATVRQSVVRFNRSVRLRDRLAEADEPQETPVEDKPQQNGRRVLMPEYVVGQKAPKRAKRTLAKHAPPAEGRGKEMQLEHLMEENEADDNEEN